MRNINNGVPVFFRHSVAMDAFDNMFICLQRRLANESDEHGHATVFGRERSETAVDAKLPSESAERVSGRRTHSRPTRKSQLTTIKQDNSLPAACNSSPEKSSTEYRTILNSSLDSTGQESSPAASRRRSARSLRVNQSCAESTVESQKLPMTPECNGETHTSAVHQSTILTSDKSPPTLSIRAKDQPRSRRSSPRRGMSSRNDEVIDGGQDANQLSGSVSGVSLSGLKPHSCIPTVDDRWSPTGVDTSVADSESLQRIPRSQRSSRRKIAASADNGVTSDLSGCRQEMKPDTDPLDVSRADEHPSSSASVQPEDMPDRVALPSGATEQAKKTAVARSRMKSSCSGEPEEKRSRRRVRSLEPPKSVGAGHSGRKSDISGRDAKVVAVAGRSPPAVEFSGRRLRGVLKKQSVNNPTPGHDEVKNGEELTASGDLGDSSGIDAAQNQSTVEDSGRRLRKSKRQGVDVQCKQTSGNNEAKVNGVDLSANGDELVMSRELGDADASSVNGLNDSTSAIPDDVRAILHSYNYCMHLCNFYIYLHC